MFESESETWREAHGDAQLVREALTRAEQLSQTDRMAARCCVVDALAALARLRSRAPRDAALLGIVLFYGIELEVRLGSLEQAPSSTLATNIAAERKRCDSLITAIAHHLDQD